MAASGGAESDPATAVVREGGSEALLLLCAGYRAREGGGGRIGGEEAWRADAARRGGGVRTSRSPTVGQRGRAGVCPMGEEAW